MIIVGSTELHYSPGHKRTQQLLVLDRLLSGLPHIHVIFPLLRQ